MNEECSGAAATAFAQRLGYPVARIASGMPCARESMDILKKTGSVRRAGGL